SHAASAAACAAGSARPRSRGAPGSGPWCPWCRDRRSCPWTPHHGRRGCARSWNRARGAGRGASAGSRGNQSCSVHLFERHQVGDGADHAADLRAVFLHHGVTDALEAEAAQGGSLALGAADLGTGLGHLDLHQALTFSARAAARPSAWARRSAAGATSSTARPRRAATASGSSSCLSASTVARTMLIWLVEPSDLESTSCTPAHSRTARTGPPAITPVPGAAGRSRTTPAASSPWTGCTTVPWMRGTRKKFFFASSTPLEIAAGTSLALP